MSLRHPDFQHDGASKIGIDGVPLTAFRLLPVWNMPEKVAEVMHGSRGQGRTFDRSSRLTCGCLDCALGVMKYLSELVRKAVVQHTPAFAQVVKPIIVGPQ